MFESMDVILYNLNICQQIGLVEGWRYIYIYPVYGIWVVPLHSESSWKKGGLWFTKHSVKYLELICFDSFWVDGGNFEQYSFITLPPKPFPSPNWCYAFNKKSQVY
jgi:hypothetical protein